MYKFCVENNREGWTVTGQMSLFPQFQTYLKKQISKQRNNHKPQLYTNFTVKLKLLQMFAKC